MPNQSTCGAPHLVRLNAFTNPPSPAEDRWLAHYGLGLERVEANAPDAILNCAADCAVLFVGAPALPPAQPVPVWHFSAGERASRRWRGGQLDDPAQRAVKI